MPRISVRSFAEMLSLPAYEQLRVLYEQKYPKKEPQTFKIPYTNPRSKECGLIIARETIAKNSQ